MQVVSVLIRFILVMACTGCISILYPFNNLYAQLTNPPDALARPKLIANPGIKYGYDKLDYGMNIGIEQTPNGRIWSCWVAGGDNEDAFFVLSFSDDNGRKWTKPKLVIDPHDPHHPKKMRTLVGCLWSAPDGALWLFFDQGLTYFDGRSGVWYSKCNNPDADYPEWSEPVRIWHGSTLNKPTVLSNGNWVLPVSLWDRGKIKDKAFDDAYHELDSLRMAHAFISKDEGKTWERQGGVRFPKPKFDEHHIMERKDGSLWMTARTDVGIWESTSLDKGKTWTPPVKYMEHISSRHFIKKLKSGNWLLVKHGEINEQTHTRSKLMAFLSADEGRTWQGGLMLDERRGVSYPDGFQSPDGKIYISYDRNRDTDGEILMCRLTEKDILIGNFASAGFKNKMIISKPEGLDKLPPPSMLKTQKK